MQQLTGPAVLGRAAVPMAKTAGLAARHGVQSAVTWAGPRVDVARAWAAPRIERSGLAVKDTIAPKICEVLAATARRVDVTAASVNVIAPSADVTVRLRRWPRVVAGTAMLAVVGAAVAVVLRRRKDDRTGEAPGGAADAESPSTDPPSAA